MDPYSIPKTYRLIRLVVAMVAATALVVVIAIAASGGWQ